MNDVDRDDVAVDVEDLKQIPVGDAVLDVAHKQDERICLEPRRVVDLSPHRNGLRETCDRGAIHLLNRPRCFLFFCVFVFFCFLKFRHIQHIPHKQ